MVGSRSVALCLHGVLIVPCPPFSHPQIDCSHGNSSKKHENQIIVAQDIASQLSSGGPTSSKIMGVMIESNINEGKQSVPPEGPAGLAYGVSVTDACLSWQQTVPALDALAKGIRLRREAVASKKAARSREASLEGSKRSAQQQVPQVVADEPKKQA